jgi:phage shock protein A
VVATSLHSQEDEMSAAVVALDPFVRGTQEGVAELRREAASAVARQQRLREELGAIRPRARSIERQASRALDRGDEILGRQILARGMVTLKAREALEAELVQSRGDVARLLTAMVRESRAWHAKEHPRPGR